MRIGVHLKSQKSLDEVYKLLKAENQKNNSKSDLIAI